MSPIIIVENEYITVQYLPDKKMIYHIVHKPIDSQSFKDALNAGTEALKKYGVCKWLSDDRMNGPLSPEFLEWSSKDWQPRTMAAGWKYWANVIPQELAAAGTLLPVIEALYELGLRMVLFTDMDKATAWLDSIKG